MSVSLLGKSRCVQTGSETSASYDSGDFLGIFRDIGIYMCKQMIDLTAPDHALNGGWGACQELKWLLILQSL
jgi:hypothetical protein